MTLSYRQATPDDLIACLDTLTHSYGNDTDVLKALPQVWRSMIASGILNAPVLEDRTRPLGERIVSLGASVFVTDAFAAEARLGCEPYISAQIIKRIVQGASPVLDSDAVRRTNAHEGLNLCILHNDHRVMPLGLHPDDRVREKHIEMFFHFHQGYKLKEFLQEAYGDGAKQWMLESGMKLRTDYAPFVDPEADRHPYLTGLTREEAILQPGSRAYQMFVYRPARFHFTHGEQALLRQALDGETDGELAQSLSASLSTIKKRWTMIYDRVSAIDSQLLGQSLEEPVSGNEGKRGAERRRHLLNYLRDHLEELNPANSFKR